MGDLRIGTAGWSYPSPPGCLDGHRLSGAAGTDLARREVRRAGVVRRALRHGGGELVVLPRADARHDAEVGGADAARGSSSRSSCSRSSPIRRCSSIGSRGSPEAGAGDAGAALRGLARRGARQRRRCSHRRRRRVEAALDPLASAGKLGALLAQFPASFKADAAVARLSRVAARHVSRLPRRGGAATSQLERRTGGHAGRCSTRRRRRGCRSTSRSSSTSIAQNFLPNVTGFYYLRLHGRNAKPGGSTSTRHDRYNYLYSSEELDPFVEIAEAVRTLVKKMYLYTNNHFEGKAVANAVMLKSRLGLPIERRLPARVHRSAIRRSPASSGRSRAAPSHGV